MNTPLPADCPTLGEDLLTDPRYTEFFAPYHPDVVAHFARDYPSARHDWQYWGRQVEAQEAADLHRPGEAAYNRLWDIQRKKLFDLQCRWRAGEAVPGIDCSFDFVTQDAAIENCTLIDPISPEELAMYCDFVRLASDFADDVLDCYYNEPGFEPREWQDYDGMRLGEEEFEQNVPDHERRGITPPAWYDFHNARTGQGFLLRLPDLRGPREQRYLQAYYASIDARPDPAAPADPRPTWLREEDKLALQEAFLRTFEAPRLRRLRAAFLAEQARTAADEQVEEDFTFLKGCDPADVVPVAPAADWRSALRHTVVATQRQLLLRQLPRVFEEYQFRQAQGISHPDATEPEWRNPLGRHMRELLLRGRELLGEPRTFDF